MKKYTVEEFREEFADVILVGSEEDNAKYMPAIIGAAKDGSHVVYSFAKLAACFVITDNMTYADAEEWVEFNVIRALPYYGEHAPEVMDASFINSRNKKYTPIKIIQKED